MPLVSKWFCNIVISFFCVLLSGMCSAESLRIYIDDEKDLLVFTGQVAPSNIAGATNNMLFNMLQDIDIDFVPSSYKRALRFMEQDPQPTCLINKVKTPIREAKFLFSIPINVYLSRRLYIQIDETPLTEPVLNHDGEVVSLAKLFQVHKNKLIVVAGAFSYGPFLDRQLAQVRDENKVVREGSNHYDTVYRMFNLKRVDFLLAYPAEVYRHVKKDNALYQSYRMAKSPSYILGYMMCNDTQLSRLFITRVNAAMSELYRQKAFMDAHLNYLPINEHEDMKRHLEQITAQWLTL